MSKAEDVRLRIADAIEDHEHEGNGLCRCGAAIGWSDGSAVEVHEAEHFRATNEFFTALGGETE